MDMDWSLTITFDEGCTVHSYILISELSGAYSFILCRARVCFCQIEIIDADMSHVTLTKAKA